MEGDGNDRLLAIGEFAAAAQLTPKALRLYDEQGLLRPASIDSSNGYRYYRVDQVATGRLIRSLREMSLSLTQIAQVLDAGGGHRELLLREFLRQAEQRLARERAAYQAALLRTHSRAAAHSHTIAAVEIPPQIVSVWDFDADRRSFNERYVDRLAAAIRDLGALGVNVASGSSCVLLEPLTEDETRLELRVPIAFANSQHPKDVMLKHLPARCCAIVSASGTSVRDGFASATDAIFDWFDRRGAHALGQPEVLLDGDDEGSIAVVRWAFATNERQK
jgi:DNA-binding transcriptional MerR regulator